MTNKLFIDTDMGLDDIISLALLSQNKQYEICGLSIVNGVSTLKNGSRNASRILAYLGIDCPIFVGINQSEQKSTKQFPKIDRIRANYLTPINEILPEGRQLKFSNLEDLKIVLLNQLQPITFLCLGPLTNIAFLLSNPKIRKNIKQIVIMGGALSCKGNVSPLFESEYNFRLDPKAAKYVLSLNIPITLVPMDAVLRVPAKIDLFPIFRPTNSLSNSAKIIQLILQNNKTDFNYFYDPLATFVLLNPSVIINQIVNSVTVITNGKLVGKSFYNNELYLSINVVTDVNPKLFYQLLLKNFERSKYE